jgi:hypothetical protein
MRTFTKFVAAAFLVAAAALVTAPLASADWLPGASSVSECDSHGCVN